MVLDNLGNSLKNTLSKISKALFVDEKLINELVKDIQKALLQSDVNVKLVLEMSKRIKEKALKTEAPGTISKKEWLIKIVYDELVTFLGEEEYNIDITKKPSKIMLVGLFGNGKCVHKDSLILLSNGRNITAEKLYEKYQHNEEYKLKDGYIIPLKNELYMPSFNTKTLKIENRKASYLWKLKSKKLMQINLDNGNDFDVKTTYEHPFFILDNGNIIQKRADELKKNDYVAIPTNFTPEINNKNFKNKIKKLNFDTYVKEKEKIERIKEQLKLKYGSLKKAVKELPYKRNYAKFTLLMKKGQVPVFFYDFCNEKTIILKENKGQKPIKFPTQMTPELAEFLGYLIGDGYLSKNSVNISNEDIEIIDRIKALSKDLFDKEASLTPDKRRKKLQNIRINSCTLVKLINELFNIPIGKKGKNLEIPSLIQKSSRESAALFLRAYFDCDGYFSPKQRQIELVSESKKSIKGLHYLLLRFNILGNIQKKQVKNVNYYRLFIQAKDTVLFRDEIYSLIKRKQASLDNYEIMTIKQGDGKKDIIPVGNLLKKLRETKGFSINQIQKEVTSYGSYEKKGWISKTQLRKVIMTYEKNIKGNFSKLISLVENKEINRIQEELQINQPLINSLIGELKNKGMVAEVTNSPTKIVTTKKGEKYFNNMKTSAENTLCALKKLAYSDVCWTKVKKVTEIKNNNKYVYDLTIEETHNFIADGIIVHNTTTAGKLGKYFSKRGQKVALISTDTWRPAAFAQLEQLGKQIKVPVFGNPKEKDPSKIYKSFEKELSKFDVVIIDTAGRDALNDELVEELNNINKAVEPDDTFLVIGADVGQAAQKQAETFHENCNVTGVIITKMDGTAKGGGSLAACSVTGAKVAFIGVGEKVDDFEKFKPKNFVGRMLGMGDIEALLEKAKEAMTEEDAQDLGKKLLKGEFSLIDLYEQMQAMKKMGPLTKVMEMVPGMGQLKLPKDMLKQQEGKIENWKFIMDSCTKEELENPDVITTTKIDRISKGSGRSISEIRDMLKQYKQGKKMMKMFKGTGSPKSMERMMKKMGGGGQKMKFK